MQNSQFVRRVVEDMKWLEEHQQDRSIVKEFVREHTLLH